MVYLVTKIIAISKGVYYGTEEAISRFVSENGDYISIKAQLWYEEVNQARIKASRAVRRIAQGKRYARKRDVTLVNPWGQPFSSRIHFKGGEK